jgi:hypothetical protein
MHSQVLNIESMRFYNDSDGWIGRASLSFSARKNVNSLYALDNNVHVQYKKGRSRFIFLNDLDLTQQNNNDLENNGFEHVRYNYQLGDSSRWWAEAFVQSQYNKTMKINFRGVTGAGPRFRVYASRKAHVYIASLYIFEHEEDIGGTIYNDHRLSSYVTFSLNFSDRAEINNTIYYQPAFRNFTTDYRISESFTAIVDITKHFGLMNNIEFAYDTKQPPGIPNAYWNFESGLNIAF